MEAEVAALLALAGVVDQELGDLAQRAALLAVIDDDAEAARLGRAGAFLDAVDEIGPAGADVGAEHVGTVALVVDAAGDLGAGIRELLHVAEQVHGGAADRRQEHVHVGTGDELGKHSGGLLEQGTAQMRLGAAEALGDAGQVPHRIDRDLDDRRAAIVVDVLAVGLEPPGADGIAHLAEIEPGAGDRDGGPDIEAFGDLGLEGFGDQMAPGVERDDALRLRPLRERPDGRGRIGVGQVGAADRVERPGRDRERAVERIGAAMGADDVAVMKPRHRADDRSPRASRGRAPVDREARLAARLRMGGETDVIGAVGRHVRSVAGKPNSPATRRCGRL